MNATRHAKPSDIRHAPQVRPSQAPMRQRKNDRLQRIGSNKVLAPQNPSSSHIDKIEKS
jgi:hypothetical protein